MFSGIVECTAPVRSVEATETGGRLILERVTFAGELAVGESVAVNGCCLTVTSADAASGDVRFDLLAETLRVTNLARLPARKPVNLERSLRPVDRLSGHFVQGHVDCVSEVLAFSPAGQDHRIEIALPRHFAQLVIARGSIGVDGISLTLAELKESSFVCYIIPHTFATTNLRAAAAGDLVNLEFDVIAKYVRRMLEGQSGG
jgi:riboflavin synthase